MDNRSMELYMRWQEASAQLNGFIRTIKLTRTTFDALRPDGKTYFQHHATTLLATHTDFVADASNPNRIYLGNPAEIERETRGRIARLPVYSPHGNTPHHNTPHHNNNDDGGDHDNDDDGDEVQDGFTLKYNGAKPPPNAFLRFRTAQIPVLRRDNPRMHETAISGVTKDMWHGMSDDEKAPWYDLARDALADFRVTYPHYYKDRLARSKNKNRREQKAKRVRRRAVEPALERQDEQHDQQRGQQHDQQHGQQHDQQHGQQHDQQHGQQHDQQHGQQHDQQHGQQHDQQHGQQPESIVEANEDFQNLFGDDLVLPAQMQSPLGTLDFTVQNNEDAQNNIFDDELIFQDQMQGLLGALDFTVQNNEDAQNNIFFNDELVFQDQMQGPLGAPEPLWF
ncbi:hypothetical protein F4801DRAFT_596415 [Xylaria longipes]|nr:hypothetical protein F4801DRAFT_596415 [Xylaria longipes]